MATDLRERLQSTLGSSYTLERELGGGGMSRVFVADETAFGRKVVVKVLPPDLAAGVSVDRFKRENQVAARLQHPHIVPVLSAGESDGLPFYTMPFVEGPSLRARLSKGGLSITEVVGVLREVARALAYAHEHGVVHRDIKPDNVMLSGASAVVTDFGIAKTTVPPAPTRAFETARLASSPWPGVGMKTVTAASPCGSTGGTGQTERETGRSTPHCEPRVPVPIGCIVWRSEAPVGPGGVSCTSGESCRSRLADRDGRLSAFASSNPTARGCSSARPFRKQTIPRPPAACA